MNYADTRDSEQLRLLDSAISDFIWRYQSRQWAAPRRTLFLFPGGMACKLLRAQTPYIDNLAALQTFNYDEVWLTPMTFLGDALTLEMHHDPLDPPAVERDKDNRIIIAGGAIDLFGLTPYDQFTRWCEQEHLDLFVFGWDWRRRLEDTVALFLARLLPRFRGAVQAACGVDPLSDFVLVGHSFGGMVVNLLLHQANSLLNTMTRAVTVAAPFYGYDGQIHRMFEGVDYFNFFLGKAPVIKVLSSLPACYTLPYLDGGTFALFRSQLQTDPAYPLPGYPSNVAGSNPLRAADPFNPAAQQYPNNTGFDPGLLQDGLQTVQLLALPPLPKFAGKFFNIRGVQAQNGAVSNNTIQAITWRLPAGPNNPPMSPITDLPLGPGDDTQPAWTARHAAIPPIQWRTVTDNIDHVFIMEYAVTQQTIAGVL